MIPRSEPSSVEKIKADSNYLRGAIAAELANPTDRFDEDTVQLLKHHGMYQQDNRDLRNAKDAQGNRLGKAYSLMVRVKIPGGRLTAEQFVAQLDLCDEIGNGTARITDRQDIQLHGILKRDVRAMIRRIHEVQLTSLGACGDVVRNVMCCPAPFPNDAVRSELQRLAAAVSDHLLPSTTAYHEIWLTDTETGEKSIVGGGPEGHTIEPLYGNTYLPRKFKVAFAPIDDNCVDVYANDLGFLAIHENGRVLGYNVVVGGGFGVTPSEKKTFPALAQPLAFVESNDVLDLSTAIVRVQRDFGNRCDRKRARMKYLIADWGMEPFKAKVEEYYGHPLAEPLPRAVSGVEDHLGWFEQGDGRWFLGVNVENGRILDREDLHLKTALREVCRKYQPGICLTASQSILFSGIRPEDRGDVEAVLRGHGVKLTGDISNARRWSMACVAMPTCPLAVTESERVLPRVIDRLEAELAQLGLADERFSIRMTGCPNGCSRPYNADVGLLGKTLGKYTIYLGGRLFGDRLAFVYKDMIRLDDIVPTLLPVLRQFAAERREGETFGDFCHRMGRSQLAE